MEIVLKKYKHGLALGILICIYIAYFATASLLRHDNFYTGRYDLGNMDQTAWNTINGKIFQSSGENGTLISRLSGHADFMLILLSPLYFIWSNPKTLLLAQTIIIGLGAVFVYLIAKIILNNRNFALTFGLLFLINPALQFTNLYDFHAVSLTTTFLLAAFYFLIRHKYALLTLFLALSGICKEQVWLITAIFGAAILFKPSGKIKLLGLSIIIISLALFYYLVSIAIPQAAGGQHFALAYYSDFGNSPLQVIFNVILSPQIIFSTILEPSRLEYLKQLFIPMGFLSLLSPIVLLFAIPDLLIDLLSSNSQLHQIYYQYSATITPFIFISAIFAVKNIVKWFPKIPKKYITAYIMVFALFSAYSFGPLPGAKNPNVDMFTKPQKNALLIEEYVSKIPEKYSVSATNNLGAHLSHRETIYTIPIGIDKADVILFLLNDRFAQPSLKAQIEMANNLKNDISYIRVIEQDDFVVFKKQGILL